MREPTNSHHYFTRYQLQIKPEGLSSIRDSTKWQSPSSVKQIRLIAMQGLVLQRLRKCVSSLFVLDRFASGNTCS